MTSIRLLVVGDAHLGYKERDPERAVDSFNSLDEALETVSKEEIDAVIMLGDLFHEANASLATINSCIDIFERRVGRKRIGENCIDLCSPSEYRLDVNAVPLFLIHGNHDVPINETKNGPLDILDKSGYVKFLGKCASYDYINVQPFVLQKKDLIIGIYPLGFVRDSKLNYLLRNGRVKFLPGEGLHRRILLVHQNRAKGSRAGSSRNCLGLSLLPSDFFDIVLWGHEHDSLPRIFEYEQFGLRVYQPGSIIATSLKRGEALPKHVGIIDMSSKELRLNPIFLKRQRPLLLEARYFTREGLPTNIRVEEALAKQIISRHELNTSSVPLPLLRVKLDVAQDEHINQFELEMLLRPFVANKGDVCVIRRHNVTNILPQTQVVERILNKQPLHKSDNSTLFALEARISNAFNKGTGLRTLNVESLLDLLHAYPEGIKPAILGELFSKNENVFRAELQTRLDARPSCFGLLKERTSAVLGGSTRQIGTELLLSCDSLKEELDAVFSAFRSRLAEQCVPVETANTRIRLGAEPLMVAPSVEIASNSSLASDSSIAADEEFSEDFRVEYRGRKAVAAVLNEKRIKRRPNDDAIRLDEFIGSNKPSTLN